MRARPARGGRILIGVTGTPAAGKSTFAASLSRATGIKSIEINSVLESSHSFYWKSKDGEKVARLKPLGKRLAAMTEGADAILVGHLAQELDLEYDCMIVVRAGIPVLAKRMGSRRYGLAKIRENLACEAVDCCAPRLPRLAGRVFEVETKAEKAEMIRAVVLGSWRAGVRGLRVQKNKMPEFEAFIRKHRYMGL